MKLSRHFGVGVAGAVVAVAMLLSSSTAHATVIYDPSDATKAIGITNLEIGGDFYNVLFPEEQTAQQIYGDSFDFTFTDQDAALSAIGAVNAALNDEATTPSYVGESGGATNLETERFLVGFSFDIQSPSGTTILVAWEGINRASSWTVDSPSGAVDYDNDARTFATFTVVPEPGSALLLALGLVGLGAGGRRRKAVA